MRVRFLFRSVIVMATLAFVGGCTPIKPAGTITPQPETPATGQPVASPAPSAGLDAQANDEPTDESIGSEIRRLLNTDPTTGAGIIVEVDGGNVTLRGMTLNRAGSWRAESVAHSVKGVKSVMNQIVVNAPSLTTQ
jgi:hypothetical protein